MTYRDHSLAGARWAILVFALGQGACLDGAELDAEDHADARPPLRGDLVPASADREQPADTMPFPPTLDALRDRLFEHYSGGAPCAAWNALDASQRAVFATLTHRLFVSTTPDGLSMLDHVTTLHLILGGGDSGTSCGGAENNRLFLSMDEYLWALMIDTWNGAAAVGDGGGTAWTHTRDLAGPHAPFDASNETEAGVWCALLVELPDSAPPTAQAHFFQPDAAAPVERGPSIQLDADPYLLEIDHDFDCFHLSNPLCPWRGFDQAYRDNYGDFACDWVPTACSPEGEGCYRGAL